jgi:methyl-accepting chemotaxis protein
MGTLEQTEAHAQGGGRNKRSVKGLLIDRRFQLKYTLIVVFLAMVISAVLGVLLMNRVSENTTLTIDNLKAMDAPAEFLSQSTKALVDRDREVMLFLVLCLVGLVLAITVLGIYVTHKVAGPIYVMSRYLRDIGSGSLRDVRNLRKGDELLEFYETFQKMLASLQDREKRDIAVLESTIGALRDQMQGLSAGRVPAAEELSHTVEALAEMKKRKQEALG